MNLTLPTPLTHVHTRLFPPFNGPTARLFGLSLLLAAQLASAEMPHSPTLAGILEQANKDYAEKKYNEARREFEQAIQRDRGSIPAWRGLGWSHWALGNKDKAMSIWTDLHRAFPDNVPTLLALGKASEQDRKLDSALQYYARILKLKPSRDAHLGRARIFLLRKQFQPAEQELRAANRTGPADANSKSLLADALMGQGKYREAEGLLRALKPVPANLIRLANTLAELGRYDEAVNIFKTSFGRHGDKKTLAAWRGLGTRLRQSGLHDRAYAVWQEILKHIPFDTGTMLLIGQAYEQDKLWQQGLNIYSLALKNAPDTDQAHLGKARIYAARKDYASAEMELKTILDRAPADMKARGVLAETMIATGRQSEAIDMFQSYVKSRPTAQYFNQFGGILTKAGHYREAIRYFRKSLQLEPDNIGAILGMAQTYWMQHDYAEAMGMLQNYLDKHPEKDLVRARLSEHAAAAGDFEKAVGQIRFLVNKNPKDRRWKIKLARLLHLSGQHQEAVQIARQLVETDPHDVKAIVLLANDAIFSNDVKKGLYWIKWLNTLDPNAERFNWQGRLHIELGTQLEEEGKTEDAMIQYASAEQAFRRASELDPIKSRSPIGEVGALRLQNKYPAALRLATNLHHRFPGSIDIIRELVLINWEQRDYSAARTWLLKELAFLPEDIKLKLDLAKLTYYSGDKSGGLRMLNKLLDASGLKNVPVLLYHGITLSDRQDTMPLRLFNDQMHALRNAGYQSITAAQLSDYLDGKNDLPAKPILITFDDARTDSLQFADPVLEQTGFFATMFVPVGDVGTHGAYTANWSRLRQVQKTGRWDMQCHSTEGQHYIPVNREGHMGRFMVNRMWLDKPGRLESGEEFAERIDRDLKTCLSTLASELGNSHVIAFAYPFSDQGHKSLSNYPDAFYQNKQLVKHNFQLAFHVDNDYPVSQNGPRYSLPRFEVPRTYTGDDLVQQLIKIDPRNATSLALGQLEMNAGHYNRALRIFEGLAQEGAIDKADYLINTGKVFQWNGDHAKARARFEKALTLRPQDPFLKQALASLNERRQPRVQLSGNYFEDNEDRSSYIVGPSITLQMNDSLSLGAQYQYLDFDQKLKSGVIAPRQFTATGHQFETRLNYELGNRTSVDLSAGIAYFSGTDSSDPSNSGSTFPLGSIQLNAGLGDYVDLSVAGDHRYVNTGGAILNGIAYSRGRGGFKATLFDSLTLNAQHAYYRYSDDNQRHRSVAALISQVLNDPFVSVGARFTRDDMKRQNPLFWTPDNYLALELPVQIKNQWSPSFTTEFSVEPGIGKESGSNYDFQINGAGRLIWLLRKNLSLNLSFNRYQAANYSSFAAYLGLNYQFDNGFFGPDMSAFHTRPADSE